MLEQRAIRIPLNFGATALSARILSVAADLAQDDFLGAERKLLELDRALADEAEPPTDIGLPNERERVAPTLRARALARILRDLATHGWAVLVESRQVYVRAPLHRTTGAGLGQAEVQAEKDRARAHVAARVLEQLQRPAMRRFITDQESLHFGASGPRSIRSLIADGPNLASALRERGAAAIQPYLQVADGDRDEHTGLRLWDIYRYFRHFWSFPFYSTPGRTLPVLIRDAGQPNHPVCGLLCLASPVPKLGVRDTALGLTPAWLESIVAGVEAFAAADARNALNDWASQLGAGSDASLTSNMLAADLHRLLRLEGVRTLESVLSALGSMTQSGRTARASGARRRLVADLLQEIESGIREIAVSDLGLTHSRLLRNPEHFLEDLRDHGMSARVAWKHSRSLATRKGPRSRKDSGNMTDSELKEFSRDPLFLKKRVAQLATLLGAWSDLAPLRRGASAKALRDLVWNGGRQGDLSGGSSVASGLRRAVQQRLSSLMAAQVADVSVCGSIPPYGPLLGGKLAALLALSRDLATLYFEQYDGQVSDIKSKMAGRAFTRPADLLALTTTSFFSIGSSQYNRVRLPTSMGSAGWAYIGLSAGHGTMHFSMETTELLQTLLKVETGQALITSEFGEGPSERLRKVRDGLTRLGLPADELLRHGTPRRVYLAELNAGETKPGLKTRSVGWRRFGPSAELVAAHWRERWLGPRLARRPELLDELDRFRREDVLLSKRLEAGDGGLALVSGGAE